MPSAHVKQLILHFVRTAPMSFMELGRVLPQIRGTKNLALTTGIILWRGLSLEGVAALESLHTARNVFFWLCTPEIYTRTGDAPFLRPVTLSRRGGEERWLPTIIHPSAPTAAESRMAVREYVAALSGNSMPRI
ncbi:MAG TPA: hypothetical protein VH867_06620 [Burkholderiales bacterium]